MILHTYLSIIKKNLKNLACLITVSKVLFAFYISDSFMIHFLDTNDHYRSYSDHLPFWHLMTKTAVINLAVKFVICLVWLFFIDFVQFKGYWTNISNVGRLWR